MTRKFTFLLMALLALTGFKSWGQQTLPYSYGFENNDLTAAGWSTVNYSPENASEFGIFSSAKHDGNYGFQFSSYTNSSNYYQYLISPQISASSEFVLQFYYAKKDSWGSETFRVGYSTTDNQISSFTYGDDIDVNSQEWSLSEEFIFPAETKYVAIHYRSNYQYRLYVDDFTFTAISSCHKPTGLTASDIAATGATISWNDSEADHYELAYGPAESFNLSDIATYTVISTSSTSVNLSGLIAETNYKCAVRAYCDDDETSSWSSAIAFTPTSKRYLTINDGTNTNQYVPFYGYYADELTKSQFIFPASYLTSMQGCSISSMDFYLQVTSNNTFTGSWDVYFKEVDYTIMPNSYESLDGMDQKVYTGNMTISNGKLTLEFDTPYDYNGGNLMMCFNQTKGGNYMQTYFYGISTDYNAAYAGYGTYSHGNYMFLPKATFVYEQSAPSFTVTVNQPTEGGEISASPTSNVFAGTVVTLSANPAFGFELNEWIVKDSDENSIIVTDNAFVMPESDVTVTATFNELSQYTITCASYTEGTIHAEYNGETITQAPAGSEITLVAEANTGYALSTWMVNGEAIEGDTFTMPEDDVTITATFDRVYYIHLDPNMVGGTIDFYIAEYTLPGTLLIPSPRPYPDYTFVEGSIVVTRDDNGEIVEVNTSVGGYDYFIMPESDVTVSASFNAIPYYAVTAVSYPTNGGYFNISATSHIEAGQAITISNINAYEGYEFASISVTCDNAEHTEVPCFPYMSSYVFNMPECDVTVTVNFNVRPHYTVTVNEVANGTVNYYDYDETPGFMSGETVYFDAIPDSDYTLESLTVTCDDADHTPVEYYPNYGSYRFSMPESNVTISATFRALATYTINYYVNGELEKTLSCKEDHPVVIDAPATIPSGMAFTGWGIAEIDPFTTTKPSIVGNYELPTQDYDLYAVFSYTESVPATSKDGETWKKVTSTSELSAGDEIVLVYNNLIMCTRENAYWEDYPVADVTISNGEITNLPENAAQFTLIANNGYWNLQYNELGATRILATNSYNNELASKDLYESWYPTYMSIDFTATTNGNSVLFSNSDTYMYIRYFSTWNQMTTSNGSSTTYACQAYKKDNPMITTVYYMTSVLTEGTVANVSAKNIIIGSTSMLTVNGTLEMASDGLFRNANTDNFRFNEGAQFIYTGTETINATFLKEINGYIGSRDNYYLIANPTDNTTVTNLATNNFDLYSFNPAQAREWNIEKDNAMVNRKIGYLYANENDVTLQFAGELIPAGETNFSLVLAEEGEGIDFPGFNLIGNPFACNAYYEGAYYRMNESGTELEVASGAIAPCEGFFVEATENGQVVSLTTSESQKSSTIALSVLNSTNKVADRAIVSFNDSNDLHKFMMDPRNTSLCLSKNGQEFAAISTDTEGEIPVGFKAASNDTYTISINTENVEAEYLHLIDNLTGMDIDLKATPSYTFNASSSNYAYRFKLVFNMKMDEQNGDNNNNFAFISNGNLVISNIEGEATLQIVDMAGRIVSSEIVKGSYNKGLNLKAGVYVIRLNEMTQKIVVE